MRACAEKGGCARASPSGLFLSGSLGENIGPVTQPGKFNCAFFMVIVFCLLNLVMSCSIPVYISVACLLFVIKTKPLQNIHLCF